LAEDAIERNTGAAIRSQGGDFGVPGGSKAALSRDHLIHAGATEQEALLFLIEQLLLEDARADGLGIAGAGLAKGDELIGDVDNQLIVGAALQELGLAELQLINSVIGLGDAVMESALEDERGLTADIISGEDLAESGGEASERARVRGHAGSGVVGSGFGAGGGRDDALEVGQDAIAGSEGGDLLSQTVELGAGDIGALGHGFGDEIAEGRQVVGGGGDWQAVHGNHFGLVEKRVGETLAAEGVFEDDFALAESGLGEGDLLSAAGVFGLSAEDLEAGDLTDLNSGFCILEEFFGDFERLPAGVQILPGGDEIPIEIDDIGDEVQQLRAKGFAGSGEVVLRDADEAAVDCRSEAIEEVMAEVELRHRGEGRNQDVAGAVFAAIRLVDGKLREASRDEALLDEGADAVADIDQGRAGAESGVWVKASGVRPGAGVLKNGIEVGSDGPDLGDLRIGVGAAAGGCGGGEAGALQGAADALASGDLIDEVVAGGNAADGATGLLALEGPLGLEGAVAIDFKIEIVLDGQTDGVLESEIEAAGAEEAVKTTGIERTGSRDGGGAVRPPDERGFGPGDEGLLREGKGGEEESGHQRGGGVAEAEASRRAKSHGRPSGREEVWET